ncbi:calcium-binding protein [Baekduia sp. Peel2402]|uniref:calcium-binding protein n=1 Tax=Baekduia sp. Peel2402 TaxID=3458296 RepID=UPI00403ED293
MRRLSALASACAILLMGATGASAATTVDRTGDVITVTGDDGPSHLTAPEYFTEAGLQDDNGGAVTASGSCTQVTASRVYCGLFGASSRIVVKLGGGEDYYKWATINHPQEVDAGAGNDYVETASGNDVIAGGPGDDDLAGMGNNDTIDGGEGNDAVEGREGNDTIVGGPGRDMLNGDGSQYYEDGNDTIDARDGEIDSVNCAGGADQAKVDAGDVVAGCEAVDRSAAPGPNPPTPNPPSPGPALPPVTLAVAAKPSTPPRLGRLASGTKLAVRLTANASCISRIALAITAAQAKALGLKKRATTLGTSPKTTLAAGQARTVKVAVSSTYRKRLRAAKRVKATVIVVCAGADGQTFTDGVAVTLKR